jgi:hypothetical protein
MPKGKRKKRAGYSLKKGNKPTHRVTRSLSKRQGVRIGEAVSIEDTTGYRIPTTRGRKKASKLRRGKTQAPGSHRLYQPRRRV